MLIHISLALHELLLEGGGSLLLVLSEGPGLVGHCGECDALASSRPDKASVGSDSDNSQRVSSREDGQGPALDLSWEKRELRLREIRDIVSTSR